MATDFDRLVKELSSVAKRLGEKAKSRTGLHGDPERSQLMPGKAGPGGRSADYWPGMGMKFENITKIDRGLGKLNNILKRHGVSLSGALGFLVDGITQAYQSIMAQMRRGAQTGLAFGGGFGGAEQGAQAMAGAWGRRITYGWEEQQQQSLMQQAIRQSMAASEADFLGGPGSRYEGGLLTQTMGVSALTGMDPSEVMSTAQKFTELGVPLGQVNGELIRMAGQARAVHRNQEAYIKDVQNLQQAFRPLNMSIKYAEGLATRFASALEKGQINIQDITSMVAGPMGREQMGARAMVAERIGLGTGYAGAAEVKAALQGYGEYEDRPEERARILEDIKSFATTQADAAGFQEGTAAHLEFTAQILEQFGIHTGDYLKGAELTIAAMDDFKDPTELFADASEASLAAMEGFEEYMDNNKINWDAVAEHMAAANITYKSMQEILGDILEFGFQALLIVLNDLLWGLEGVLNHLDENILSGAHLSMWGDAANLRESETRNTLVGALGEIVAEISTVKGVSEFQVETMYAIWEPLVKNAMDEAVLAGARGEIFALEGEELRGQFGFLDLSNDTIGKLGDVWRGDKGIATYAEAADTLNTAIDTFAGLLGVEGAPQFAGGSGYFGPGVAGHTYSMGAEAAGDSWQAPFIGAEELYQRSISTLMDLMEEGRMLLSTEGIASLREEINELQESMWGRRAGRGEVTGGIFEDLIAKALAGVGQKEMNLDQSIVIIFNESTETFEAEIVGNSPTLGAYTAIPETLGYK